MKKLLLLAPLLLSGCSAFVIDDHSYNPPPDPMGAIMLMGILALIVGIIAGAALVPSLLQHSREMTAMRLQHQQGQTITNQQAAALQQVRIGIAQSIATQMGWPLELALQHVDAAARRPALQAAPQQTHYGQLTTPRY